MLKFKELFVLEIKRIVKKTARVKVFMKVFSLEYLQNLHARF